MPFVIVVKEISCDRCGYRDTPDKFPETPPEIQKEFGSIDAGVICPMCGNFAEFDFDPNNRRREEDKR